MIKLDKIDRDYIKDVLIKCQTIMTQKAIDILNEKSEIHS